MATVQVGSLSTDDVSVQLAHGRVGGNGELSDPHILEMTADTCENVPVGGVVISESISPKAFFSPGNMLRIIARAMFGDSGKQKSREAA